MRIRRSKLLPAGLFLAAGLALSGFGRPEPSGGLSAGFQAPESYRSVVQRGDGGNWNLIAFPEENHDISTTVPIIIDDDFRNLSVYTDGSGAAWLVGEISAARGGMIRVGRLSGQSFTNATEVGLPSGWNGPADLCFPEPERPWLAWRHQAGPNEEIWAQDIAGGRRWLISPAGTSSLTAPKIQPDGRGGLWAIWAEKENEEYFLTGRHYDGRAFTDVVRIAGNGDRPLVQPDLRLGSDGTLWAVWSAYDGYDYELFAAEAHGGDWTLPRPLTNSPQADGQPRLTGLGRSGAAVAWIRSGFEGAEICASALRPESPAAPVRVLQNPGAADFDVIGSDTGLSVIPRGPEVPRKIRIASVDLLAASLDESESQGKSAPTGAFDPTIITNTSRDDSKYIAFGDSITYGEYYGVSDPTVGYPPRLDHILDTAFGPTTIINSGVPGEETSAALARINAVLAANSARWILVMEGTNDVKLTNIEIPTSIYNLKEICRRCLAAGVLPVLATVIPRRDWIWYYSEYVARHYALEAGIRQIAADLKIPLVDMEAAFNSYAGGPDSLLQPDGKHPNLTGYQFLAENWAAAARKLPFPPVNLRLQKKTSVSTVMRPFPQARLQNIPGYARVTAAGGSGYLLSWQANPKTADISVITGYRIYRKKRSESAASFALAGTVSYIFAFLDKNVVAGTTYDYVIATVGPNGVEGPCSVIISN